MKNTNTNWLYIKDKENENRFILGENGNKIIACIGVNPSKAKPDDLDPTLKTVKSIAISNGFDGWIMYNLYPQLSTDPDELHENIDHNLNISNQTAILKSIVNLKINTVWVAWGDLINHRDYLFYSIVKLYDSLMDLELEINWKIVDEPTIKGNPKHPLYKKYSSELKEFKMNDYIEEIARPKIKNKGFDDITIDGNIFK